MKNDEVTFSVPKSIYEWHLGTSFFLIYINNMPNGLKSNVKLFAGDTSIFSIIKNKNNSAKDLTHDLSLISKWAFNPLVLNALFLYP